MKYPLLARELQRWWEKQKVYRDRGQLADAADLSPNTLSRYFAGARFPDPAQSEALQRVTGLKFFASDRTGLRARERRGQALHSRWAKELLGLSDHYVRSTMGQLGEVSKRRRYAFSFRILSTAEKQGIRTSAGLTAAALIGLDLRYKPERQSAALLFFADFLIAVKKWGVAQERDFNARLNRWPARTRATTQGAEAAANGRVSRPRLVRHRRAKLPFSRPECLRCRIPLTLGSKHFSNARGDHWYLDCAKCGQRYWSSEGQVHRVNQKGSGNWRDIKNRVRCPDCDVECTVSAAPTKLRRYRYWICPRCHQRYRSVKGRAVATQSGGQSRVKLSFLPNRKCPHCEKGRLFIKSREKQRLGLMVYLRCGECDSSFRWSSMRKRLVRLRRRKGYVRRPHVGRRSGKDPARMEKAAKLHQFMEKFTAEHGTRRGALVYAIDNVYPGEKNSRTRYATAAQMVKEYRAEHARTLKKTSA